MSAPCQDVCTPWCTDADMPCDLTDIDPDVLADAQLVASNILYNLTRQRWPGWCQDTARPCADYASPDTIRRYPAPRGVSSYDGAWFVPSLGYALCSCAGRPSRQVGCHHLSQITLDETPITSIIEVRIDGDIVDPARYRVDSFRWLVYQPDQTGADTRAGWPCCQRMELPAGEVGTFEVVYTVGTPPDRGGVRAAATYACEFAKAWTPALAAQCKLPKRATSMTRQQLTVALSDPTLLVEKGLVGIPGVDDWVQSVLNAHRNRPAVVLVPERRRQATRRTTS